jgi:hypothetical protein
MKNLVLDKIQKIQITKNLLGLFLFLFFFFSKIKSSIDALTSKTCYQQILILPSPNARVTLSQNQNFCR